MEITLVHFTLALSTESWWSWMEVTTAMIQNHFHPQTFFTDFSSIASELESQSTTRYALEDNDSLTFRLAYVRKSRNLQVSFTLVSAPMT